MTVVSTLNPLSPSMAIPTNSQIRTPSFCSSYSALTLSPLRNVPGFSSHKGTANNRLFLTCSCGAVTINGNHSTSLFVQSGTMLLSLFQEMGFNEKETEVILNANSALNVMPFETLRTRIHYLQSTGVTGLALSRLIAKRPAVLTSPDIDALLCFVVNDINNLEMKGKINPSQMEKLLNVAEPRFLLGFEKKVRLLLEFGIPKDDLVHVLNNVNLTKALCFRPLEEIGRMLAFLGRYGGAALILRRPATLNYDLEVQLMPRIGYLLELSGGDEVATATVLRKLPFVLAYTVDHVKDHVEFLHSYAELSYEEIFKIILVYPSLFSASRKRKLHPRIDFLKQCGLNSNDIYKFLIKAPCFLSLSFEGNLAFKLTFMVKIGYQNNTKEMALAMGAVTRCSCKNLQEVIGLFLNYGLTCEDIYDMSKKHRQVLQYNHESLEEKLDYLIDEMGREVGELLAFPAFLGYKLDGRIKHRYEVKRKVLGEGMSINKLLSVSAARFSNKSKKKTCASVTIDLTQNED